MIGFEYDGQYLSDYGFIVCKFDAQNSFAYSSIGSMIKFNKVARDSGKKFSLTSTEYSECIAAEFDICKNPDIYDPNDREITYDEYKTLVRWLNRREFLRFRITGDTEGRDDCYYNASFNIQKIKLHDVLYGLRLEMETDKPFGYGQEQTVSLDFTDKDDTKVLRNISDEIGSICPNMTITCNCDGDLSIYNELEDCTMAIKNCSIGEIITIYGENQIISSTLASHKIGRDFNYEFFRIGNLINDRDNKISSSLPCHIEIKYTPIIKDTP